MAGSIAWYGYTADSGVVYAVRVDKSNAIATGGFIAPTDTSDWLNRQLPKTIRMRYILVKHPTKPISRRLPIGDPDNTYYSQGGKFNLPVFSGATATSEEFIVSGSVGETKTFVSVADTAQTA